MGFVDESITASTKAKQIGYILAGYIQADDDIYSNRRRQIVMINQKAHSVEAPSSKQNEGENMVNVLEKAKIDFIKKHIRLRKDGRYEYRIRENGKNISKSDKDYNTVINMALGKIKKRKPNTKKYPTLVEYCWQFYNRFRAKNKSQKTKAEYANMIDFHIKSYFEGKTIDKITSVDLQDFINSIKGDRIREKVFNFMSSVFNKAVALKDLKFNPAIAVELPSKAAKARKRSLRYDEQVKLLNAIKTCSADFQRFVIFSLIIGTRREETCAFRLKDIDTENNLLTIHGTKTANAARVIKISDDMIKYLFSAGKTVDEQYFEMLPDSYRKKLSKIYDNLNFKNVDVHSLRRTCATNLYYLGVSDKQRQQVLGHASIVTTNDIYTFLESDMTKEKIKNLYNGLYFSDYR